jgi:UDP:flavonoid glycosyltransferase YjiC (YdhE family)
MYAILTAVPLVGHLNPLIRLAQALERRGWHAPIACATELRAHVNAEAPGLPFLDLGPLGSATAELRRNEEFASRDATLVRGSARIVRGLHVVWPMMFDGLAALVARERPDVMVVDLFSSAGMSVAESAGIPWVVNNPDLLAAISVKLLPPADEVPFVFSGRSIRDIGWHHRLAGPLLRRVGATLASATVGRDLNKLRASRGLPSVDVHEMLRDRLILVDGAFGLEYRRPIPPFVEMVGPLLPPEMPCLTAEMRAWLSEGPPVVYVNMGTMAVAPTEQLSKMVEAFAMDEVRVLWILRKAQQARLPDSRPAGLRLLDWGPPPLAVLAHPNVRAFVSHCGINSVHESLHAGTPIVGIPMFADQRDMAVRVADAGVGLWLDKRRFTAVDLRGAIRRVLHEPVFTRNIPTIQAAFQKAGGVERAADLVVQAARARVSVPT